MSDFTTRDGCRIAYDVHGDGPTTLVVVPGWSQSAAQFDRLLPLVTDELRVVTYDHRNHGRSGASEDGARVATLGADLRELLEHLGITSAHFLGHSLGCSVLWSFVDQHGTSAIESLVLVDQPTVCAVMPWLDPTEAADAGAILDFAGAFGFVQALLGPESDAARVAFLTSMLTPDMSEADRAWMLEQNMLLRMPYGAKLLMDHVMQDWRDVLPRIDVPTLVVGGEVSHVAPASQEWSAAHVPGARVRIFTREEGGAHFPFLEDPPTFAAELLAFLRGAAA